MIWELEKKQDEAKIKKLQEELNVSRLVSVLLLNRNIDSFDKAKGFFRPSLDDLHDPFLMQDMQQAVDRIQKAINDNENILVFGDYDVDGTTSASLVSSFLNNHTKNNVLTYIPDRYKEGYGISTKSIDYAASKEINLIIALDCGIQAVNKVEYANTHHKKLSLSLHIYICVRIPKTSKRKTCK